MPALAAAAPNSYNPPAAHYAKAAQHYRLPAPVIHTYLDKEPPAPVGAVVEVDDAIIFPA